MSRNGSLSDVLFSSHPSSYSLWCLKKVVTCSSRERRLSILFFFRPRFTGKFGSSRETFLRFLSSIVLKEVTQFYVTDVYGGRRLNISDLARTLVNLVYQGRQFSMGGLCSKR